MIYSRTGIAFGAAPSDPGCLFRRLDEYAEENRSRWDALFHVPCLMYVFGLWGNNKGSLLHRDTDVDIHVCLMTNHIY